MIASPDLLLKDRFDAILSRIRTAAQKAGRSPSDIELLAATKTVPPAIVLEAVALGVRHIGENRVQEALAKREALSAAAVMRHLIGQLQTNKARKAVELFDVIQSIDRPRVADAVARAAGEAGKRQRCLIELKISSDASKAGVPPDEADALIRHTAALAEIELAGLMAIGPLDADDAQTLSAFREAAATFDRHRHRFGASPILSMGMTDDFELAIAAGSTMVRVGRALFGERISTDA